MPAVPSFRPRTVRPVLHPPAEAELPAILPLPSADTTTPATAPAIPPAGFLAMFNSQDLAGWSVHDGKSESWKFVDGAASCVAPGGGWLQSEMLLSDFELQFEYRLSAGGNSGVSLRFPVPGTPPLRDSNPAAWMTAPRSTRTFSRSRPPAACISPSLPKYAMPLIRR